MKLITILESHNASDLAITRTILEDAGIVCYLKNELSTQVLNHLPYMTVELQVSDSDVERAQDILQKIE